VLYIRELIAVLLVQGRGEIAVMPAVTAVLLHHSAMDTGTDCSVVVQGRREMADMAAVIVVLLLHSTVDTGTDCSVVSTG